MAQITVSSGPRQDALRRVEQRVFRTIITAAALVWLMVLLIYGVPWCVRQVTGPEARGRSLLRWQAWSADYVLFLHAAQPGRDGEITLYRVPYDSRWMVPLVTIPGAESPE